MTDFALPPVARPNYFTGEALLTDDFVCEQRFQMGSRAAVNGALHTYGIAVGLEVQWHRDTQPNQVHVSAGMAIDRLGREIVLSQPQLVTLSGIEAGATYYLTIRHHEVFGGLTDESGVLGYKRVIQQPRITYERTLRDPGENILLAVLTFTQQGAIDSLAYRAGCDERRYVGGRFGSLSLITEGEGIATPGAGGARMAGAPAVRLEARRETDASGSTFLEVEAARSQFSGQLTTRGELGIGVDHPTASLQIATQTLKGRGTFTTSGTLLILTETIEPGLQPGDLFIPDVSAALPAPQPAQVAIAAALDGGLQYRLAQAFASDFTKPTRFTFARTTLARIGDPKLGDLLSVRNDGTLWLGTLATPSPGSTVSGPGVLSITPDRRVGIGLSGCAVPQATLQVAGGILTDQLVSNGAVKAQSFEGNGSKLTNLSVLSYWTKTNVAASNSPLYYDQGNVGMQITTPPATLSAGTRPPFVGSGLISWDPSQPFKITGFQTLFASELGYGDSITVGKLEPQRQRIARIVGDGELTLEAQFTVVVQQSAYSTLGAEAGAQAQAGPGTVSSSGTTIVGEGTRFTALKEGDFLVIEAFQPVDALTATWMVESVKSNTELTLQSPADGAKPAWEANASAYTISSGLMGYFQSNEGRPLNKATIPPAMLIKANGANGSGSWSDNTVAINMRLEDTDPKYALQVQGDVNFAGQSVFDNVKAGTLTVTKSLTVSGDGSADELVSIKESAAGSPLLTVTKTSVQLGAVGAGDALLNVGGDVSATGTVKGATLSGGTVTSDGAMNCHGLFTGASLSVSGVAINGDGSVQAFGNRTSYNQNNLSDGSFSATAATDGLVVAFLGTVSRNFDNEFASVLKVTTSLPNGTVTSTMATATSTRRYTYSTGRKELVTLLLPTYGTISMPVRKGEIWSVEKTDLSSESGINSANLVFYWVPLGTGGKSVQAMAAVPPEQQPFHELDQSMDALRANVLGGAVLGAVDENAVAATQRTIDERVGDFTRILGDATGMSAAPEDRAAFIADLQAIVCRATPAGIVGGGAEDSSLEALADTFARITGRSFPAEQREMLKAGVRALVEINATERNRNDLDLIKTNITLFLDTIARALDTEMDQGARRLLTRALVRLVGDGSQRPEAPASSQAVE